MSSDACDAREYAKNHSWKSTRKWFSIGSVILDFSNLIFSNKLCYAIFGNYNYDLKLRVQCYLIILSKNEINDPVTIPSLIKRCMVLNIEAITPFFLE